MINHSGQLMQSVTTVSRFMGGDFREQKNCANYDN